MHYKKYLAEFIGTFGLVFCGTGAIVIDEYTHGAVTHVGVAMTFGLIVLAMIYTFGEHSGAHFNPAVTIGFAMAKRFDGSQVLPYITFQILGAFVATGILKFLFPDNGNLGSTLPAGSQMQSFILESILTYLLMLVIINVSQGSKEVGVLAGIAIGATVGLEALFARTNLRSFHEPRQESGTCNNLGKHLRTLDLPRCTNVGSNGFNSNLARDECHEVVRAAGLMYTASSSTR